MPPKAPLNSSIFVVNAIGGLVSGFVQFTSNFQSDELDGRKHSLKARSFFSPFLEVSYNIQDEIQYIRWSF